MSTALVIAAAGAGERLGAGEPKALTTVASRSLVVHAVRAAVAARVVDVIVVSSPPGRAATLRADLAQHLPSGLDVHVTDGGASRQDSVRLAIEILPLSAEIILVHDAARCLAPPSLFRDIVAAVESGSDAVVPVLPVVDTLKRVDGDRVIDTPDRSALRAVQTPQGFRAVTLLKAHRMAVEHDMPSSTDDAGLVEAMGGTVHVIPGSDDAFKVTRPADVLFAEAVAAARELDRSPENRS